jgi:MqsR-controlled colanic acid and biofilm protein A
MSHAVYEDMLMKITSLLFAAALTAHAAAASPLPPTPVLPYAGPLRPVGTVSASGASTLDDLVAALADKAHRQGAIAWRVNAASSGNRLHGSAIIYQ